MQKPIAALVFCILAVATVLGGCQETEKRHESTLSGLERVAKTRTLRAAFINYPPSFIIDPNSKEKSGIMHEVIAAAAQALGLKLDYVEETTWATMIDTLNSGRADIVASGIWPSSARALRADFSRAVYYSPVYAYVKAGDKRFDGDLSRANNQKIRLAAIDGELSSIVANSDFPEASVVSLPQQTDVSQLLLQLSSGKADITFVEPAIAEEYLAKNPGSLKRVENVAAVRIFPNTFLFRKGDVGLRDAINVAIVELENSGAVQRMIQKYDRSGRQFTLQQLPVTP